MVCGYSAIGKSHENEGIKCQDNCYFGTRDNISIVAVADGVSSSRYSDVASRIAVKHLVAYCLKRIRRFDSPKKILNILRGEFEAALLRIKQIAINAPNEFDTTLTVAVVINDNLYFGQIGDSGIIALLSDGRFERITEEQNGEGIGKDKPVYPLAAITKWSFGFKSKIKALFLATDGVLKKLQPSLLGNQKYPLNHNYLCYIFNNIYSTKDSISAQEWIQQEVANISPQEVDYDDKTLCVLINLKNDLKMQAKDYYNFPTNKLWNQLVKENEEKLYPYRTNKKTEIEEPKEKDISQNPTIEEKEPVKKESLNEESLNEESLNKESLNEESLKNKKDSKGDKADKTAILVLFIIVVILIILLFNL